MEPCTSYGEKLLREIMKLKYGDEPVLYNDRPPWLMSPHTWRNLELDIYFPYKGEAWEFNGKGHVGINDNDKSRLCQEMNVDLHCISHEGLSALCKLLPANRDRDDLLLRIEKYQKCKFKNSTTA